MSIIHNSSDELPVTIRFCAMTLARLASSDGSTGDNVVRGDAVKTFLLLLKSDDGANRAVGCTSLGKLSFLGEEKLLSDAGIGLELFRLAGTDSSSLVRGNAVWGIGKIASCSESASSRLFEIVFFCRYVSDDQTRQVPNCCAILSGLLTDCDEVRRNAAGAIGAMSVVPEFAGLAAQSKATVDGLCSFASHF